jgi:hypothetical protein
LAGHLRINRHCHVSGDVWGLCYAEPESAPWFEVLTSVEKAVSWLVFSFDIPLCLNCQRPEMGGTFSTKASLESALSFVRRAAICLVLSLLLFTCFPGLRAQKRTTRSLPKWPPASTQYCANRDITCCADVTVVISYSGVFRPRTSTGAQCRLLSQIQ